MRCSLLAAAVVAFSGVAVAEDKGTEVELGSMKSTTPAKWKKDPTEKPLRMATFVVPKSEGDKDDAEVAIFMFPGGSGTVKQNLERQLAKFVSEGRKDSVDKIKVGEIEATYQDVSGTFIKKKGPFVKEGTPIEGYRQLYVVFELKDGKQYYLWLLGPAKTVGDNKKAFEEWLKNFK